MMLGWFGHCLLAATAPKLQGERLPHTLLPTTTVIVPRLQEVEPFAARSGAGGGSPTPGTRSCTGFPGAFCSGSPL